MTFHEKKSVQTTRFSDCCNVIKVTFFALFERKSHAKALASVEKKMLLSAMCLQNKQFKEKRYILSLNKGFNY